MIDFMIIKIMFVKSNIINLIIIVYKIIWVFIGIRMMLILGWMVIMLFGWRSGFRKVVFLVVRFVLRGIVGELWFVFVFIFKMFLGMEIMFLGFFMVFGVYISSMGIVLLIG